METQNYLAILIDLEMPMLMDSYLPMETPMQKDFLVMVKLKLMDSDSNSESEMHWLKD